jgi:uncharacterized protein (TIGR02444 family)
MADAAQSTTAFERFSVSLYGRSQVADACLWLQDHCGMDVNFVLFAVFCGCRGTRMSAEDWSRLDRHVTPWRQQAVLPLRAVRRWLKDYRSDAAIDVAGLHGRVLACETACELAQQRMMDATFPTSDGRADERAIAHNLKTYCSAQSVGLSETVVDRLCTIVREAVPALSSTGVRTLMS